MPMLHIRLGSSIPLLLLLALPKGEGGEHFSSSQQAVPSQPSATGISIVSPADGTIVRPGEILHIDVSVPAGKTVRVMAISSSLGDSEARESPPWSFTLTIPKQGGVSGGGPLLGKHPIYAMVAMPGHEPADDLSITVDVERPDMPVELWTEESDIHLVAFGQEHYLNVTGVFPDGIRLKLNESCCLSFSSSDPKVATVTDHGAVTAIGPGDAVITTTYRQGESNDNRSIPLNVASPAVNVSPRVLNFGETAVGSTSAPLEFTVTNLLDYPMHIPKPEIYGEFSETDDCLSSLLAEKSGTCTVRVTFKPKVKGFNAGKITIYGQTTIHLSGVAI
jgi:hypothetical protein